MNQHVPLDHLTSDQYDQLCTELDELRAELGDRTKKARKKWIANQEKQLGIKSADFRAGNWEMDLAMGREMAAAYVAMAKTMLGDAPNYSETTFTDNSKLHFDVKIAESPERYTLTVQRHAPGALTPHEVRQKAEQRAKKAGAERDELATALREVLAWFLHETHPGQRCLQSGHVPVATVDRWRALAWPPQPGPAPTAPTEAAQPAATCPCNGVCHECDDSPCDACTAPEAAPTETERCCVCGGGPVKYRNYRAQPFCWPCAECGCGQTPCVRTGINNPAETEQDEAADARL